MKDSIVLLWCFLSILPSQSAPPETQPKDDIIFTSDRIDCQRDQDHDVCILHGTSTEPATVTWGDGEDRKTLTAHTLEIRWKADRKATKNESVILGAPQGRQFDSAIAHRNEDIADSHVRMEHKQMSLKADRCVYTPSVQGFKGGVVDCVGNIFIKNGDHTGRGDHAKYDMKEHKYVLSSKDPSRRAQATIPVASKSLKIKKSESAAPEKTS